MKISLKLPSGLAFPSMAAIPFRQSLIIDEYSLKTNWHLFENGEPIPSSKHVVARWPDGSIKWAHVYAIFKGGEKYKFRQNSGINFPPVQSIPPDDELNWELEVEEGDGTKWINTATDRANLVLVPLGEFTLKTISRNGSRVYNNFDETKCIEINDAVVRQTRYEGWLKAQNENRFLRYCTRVTRYAGSPITKISHSIIFAGRMRNKEIKHIRFTLYTQNNAGKSFYGINGNTKTNLAPPGLRTLQVHQRRIDICEVTAFDKFERITGKSDGFVNNTAVSIFVRNFWQKFPQSLGCSQDKLIYNQWYGKSEEFSKETRLDEKNLSKLYHWHHGETLKNSIPKTNDNANPEWADRYYSFISKEEVNQNGLITYTNLDEGGVGGVEEYKAYTDYADMQGITIHDEIAIVNGSTDLQKLAKVWQKNPVGFCKPTYIEKCRLLDFASKSTNFSKIENFLETSILSYTDPERFEDYGRFIYGDSHRNILPYFNRPSFHRLFLGSYYSAGETYWRMRLRGSGNKILQLARRNTERYQSIVQVSYDEFRLQEGNNALPETQWHKPGAFWYRGLWWGNIYPLKNATGKTLCEALQPPECKSGHGGWTRLQGRHPDPDTFYWSWIMDGNWYAKDGYELWYQHAKDGIGNGDVREKTPQHSGNAREFNKTLVYAITAYDYYSNYPVEGYEEPSQIIDLANRIKETGWDLLNHPLDTKTATGPLWHPEWLNRFIDFLMIYDNNDNLIEKHKKVSEVLKYVVSYYNSNFIQYNTLCLAVVMTDIANNKYRFFENYYNLPLPYDTFLVSVKNAVKLEDHLYFIAALIEKICKSPGRWEGFGVGDGELGDSMLKLQWGSFLRCLREASIDESAIADYRYSGHYPSSSRAKNDYHPRSLEEKDCNEFVVMKSSSSPLVLTIKFSPNLMDLAKSFSNREIWIISPSGEKRFLPIVRDPVITSETYENVIVSDSATNPRHLGPLESLKPNVFTSYSSPCHVEDFLPNWEQSTPFLTESGTEHFTVRDTFENQETGIFKIWVRGRSMYAGITENNLPEAMILRNITRRNYVFSNCRLYIKNLENRVAELKFWASVEVAIYYNPQHPERETGAFSYGSFARVTTYNVNEPDVPLDSGELQFDFNPARPVETGYGQEGEMFSVSLPPSSDPNSVLIIKIVLLYQSTVVRLTPGSNLLCARSQADIDAFNGYIL